MSKRQNRRDDGGTGRKGSSGHKDLNDGSGDRLDQILEDRISPSGRDVQGAEDGEGYSGDIDEYMSGGKKSRLGLLFLLAIVAVIVVLVGYIFVNPMARTRVIAFLRGDLLDIDRQTAQDLSQQYEEKEARLQEKDGSIRLQYFPMTARVSIIQQAYVYADMDAKERKAYGGPTPIDNDSLHLAADEELPELNIQNLPIRERGKICMTDGQFYPSSRVVCPGWEKCIPSSGAVAEGEEGMEAEAAPIAPKTEDNPACAKALDDRDVYTEGFCDKVPDECKEGCECFVHSLKSVDFCTENGKYYPATAGAIQRCPDSDIPMDPSKVPVFVYDYSFLFEAPDYLPAVVSYTEENWKSLGSNRYMILFPKDFSLLRDWVPVLEKFQMASKGIRCWDRAWEDLLQTRQRERALKEGLETLAAKAKEKEEKELTLKNQRKQLEMVVNEIGTLRKLKKMATIIDSRGELFWFCVAKGQCDEANMATLKTEDEEAYWATWQLMDPTSKAHPDIATEMARRPILTAGIVCLDKWMPAQAKNDKAGRPNDFIVVDATLDPKAECDAAIAGLQGSYPDAAQALVAMFKDAVGPAGILMGDRVRFEDYFKSRAEFGGDAQAYDDMILKAEAGARHVLYLTKLYLFAPDTFDATMEKLVESRQANHLADAQEKGIWLDPARGYKAAVEVAWWIGLPVFNNFYNKLWEYDVQGCLLFVKDKDPVRFETDRLRFKELMDRYKEVQKQYAVQARWFKDSVEPFVALRQKLAEALGDPAGALARYPSLDELKASDPDLAWGLLRIRDPRTAMPYFDAMMTLPEVQPGTPPKVQGDQPQYHVALFYASIFEPPVAQQGMELLRKRLEPFFQSEEEYAAAVAGRPDAPPYREAVSDLVNNDIPLKYFWLVRLLENPSTFEREIARLDYAKTLLVAKSLDVPRYKYLTDLVWYKHELDRDQDIIPLLSDWTILDRSILEEEKERLASWSKRKAATERKFKRSVAASAWLREPTMVERAMDTSLQMNDRYALLMGNLEQTEEGEVIGAIGNALRDEGQAQIELLAEWWKKHGETGNQAIRATYAFSEARWSPLVDEIKITFPKWYTYLDEGLQHQRANCLEPDCLKGWLGCRLDNVVREEEEEKEPKDCKAEGLRLPPCN